MIISSYFSSLIDYVEDEEVIQETVKSFSKMQGFLIINKISKNFTLTKFSSIEEFL